MKFPHVDAVARLSLSAFKAKYQSWCKKEEYRYSEHKAEKIHEYARTLVSTIPLTESIKTVISEAAKTLNSTLEALSKLHSEMDALSAQLPEYEVVMDMYGVGKILGSQHQEAAQFKSSRCYGRYRSASSSIRNRRYKVKKHI